MHEILHNEPKSKLFFGKLKWSFYDGSEKITKKTVFLDETETVAGYIII